MQQTKIIFVQLLAVAILVQPLLAAPIFWFLPWSFPSSTSTTTSSSSSGTSSATNGASNSSNVSVAIGNRVNTSTGLDDYGTNITNVQINVNRMRRAVTDADLAQLGRNIRQTYDDRTGAANGSVISVGKYMIRLPANISNLTVNTYLINGIPEDDLMMPPDTNSNDPVNPLLTAVGVFKNFLSSFFGGMNGI
uniref:Uncharacterized protein n=1 Tax=Anopheles farauti TaxID=69004 RepID=A0A182Q9S4_9DIPT